MRRTLGFTLVEIIMVVAVIGVLSSITYVGLGAVRDDAANKVIAAELKNMQIALELYKSENGVYPDIVTTVNCSNINLGIRESYFAGSGGKFAACENNMPYVDGLSPDFISEQVGWEKSRNDSCVISYQVASDWSWYKLSLLNCYAGADDYTEGVQLHDDLALCPSTCADCKGVPGNYHESGSFYNSMAIFGGDFSGEPEQMCI